MSRDESNVGIMEGVNIESSLMTMNEVEFRSKINISLTDIITVINRHLSLTDNG